MENGKLPKDIVKRWLDYIRGASPILKDWLIKEKRYLKNNIHKNFIVLDVGCGNGRHMKYIAGSIKNIVGIDNQKFMIAKAEKTLKNEKNTKLFLQDASILFFRDDIFDCVICMGNTFGNFGNDKLDILNEMKRVVKKNGKIILSVYSEKALATRLENYSRVKFPIIKINYNTGEIYSSGGDFTEQFSRQQLENLFSQAGLKPKISELNPISYIVEARK
jgi:ubiquinone/menaquinone biosynthesis C-methylase UbiE